MKAYNNRNMLRKYISGAGIEIGALQNPLDLSGLQIKKIQYVDKLSNKEIRSHYPELKNIPIVKPDIIDDAQVLEKIENNSLDFIIANHLVEHLDNPILALINWAKKLNGIIFLTVPDKKFTFDKKRALTSIKHLVNDYECTKAERYAENLKHYRDWVKYIQKKSGKLAGKEVRRLIHLDYSIHFHVWTFTSFKIFITSVINKYKLPLEIADYSDTIVNEFTFILKRVNT